MKNLCVIRHTPTDTLDHYAPIFGRHNLTLRYLDTEEQIRALHSDEYEGLIVLGGAVGQCEVQPAEYARIEACVQEEKPYLGICLGAQLLSQILGGNIYPNPTREVGWISIELTEQGANHPIRHLSHEHTQLMSWHQDTCDIPAGATHLGFNEVCNNQAFQYGNAIGVQFHLEIPVNPFQTWLRDRHHELQQYVDDMDQFESQTKRYLPAYNRAVGFFLDEWLSVVI